MDNLREAVDKVIHKKLWITCVAHCRKKIKKKFSTNFVEKKSLTRASPAVTAAGDRSMLIYVVVCMYVVYVVYSM